MEVQPDSIEQVNNQREEDRTAQAPRGSRFRSSCALEMEEQLKQAALLIDQPTGSRGQVEKFIRDERGQKSNMFLISGRKETH